MRFKLCLALLCIILLTACATGNRLPTPEEAMGQGRQSVRLATMVWQDTSSLAADLCNQGALSITDCNNAKAYTETARRQLSNAAAYLDGDRTAFGDFGLFYAEAYESIRQLQALIENIRGRQ